MAVEEVTEKKDTIAEVTPETEFEAGFDSVNPFNKVMEVKTDEPPDKQSDKKPDEKPVKDKATEDLKPDDKTETGKSTETDKKKERDPEQFTRSGKVEGGDNGKTYKARWKTSEGIIRATTTKLSETERLLAEKEAEIARIRIKAESKEKPAETTIKETEPTEIDKLESQYHEAFIEGETETATKLRKQIRELEWKQLQQMLNPVTEIKSTVETVVSAREQQTKNDDVVKTSITKFPFLDIQNEELRDMHAIGAVKSMTAIYQGQGLSFDKALEAAVAEVAPRFAAMLESGETDEEVVDADKIQSTVAVKIKNTPIKTTGKPKGLETFDEGFDSVKPFG